MAYKLKGSGIIFDVAPLTQSVIRKTASGLNAEGIKLTGDKSTMTDNLDFQLELTRRVLTTLKKSIDGPELLAGLKPAAARTLISEISGLTEAAIKYAKKAEEEAGECEELELGNS